MATAKTTSDATPVVSSLTKEDAEFIAAHVRELFDVKAAWKRLAESYFDVLGHDIDPNVARALESQQKLAFAENDRLNNEIHQLLDKYYAAMQVIYENS